VEQALVADDPQGGLHPSDHDAVVADFRLQPA
jgi:hypothetical protein